MGQSNLWSYPALEGQNILVNHRTTAIQQTIFGDDTPSRSVAFIMPISIVQRFPETGELFGSRSGDRGCRAPDMGCISIRDFKDKAQSYLPSVQNLEISVL